MKDTIIIVTGTPNSGLSTFGQCLRILGLTPLDNGEQTNISTIHALLFEDLDYSPNMAGPLPKNWMQTPGAIRARKRMDTLIANSRNEIVPVFLEASALCRFMPLWTEAFRESGLTPLSVLMVRHPWEVALSLERKANLDLYKGALLWFVHIHDFLRFSRESALVTFDQLLADPVSTLARIGTELDLIWPKDPRGVSSSLLDFVQPSLKEHYAANLKAEDKEVFQAYERLYQEIRSKGWAGMIRDNSAAKHATPRSSATSLVGKGMMSAQSQVVDQSDLLESLLDVIGQYEKQSTIHHITQKRTETEPGPPLSAQVVFPTTGEGEEIVETIPLIADQWQKISLSVPIILRDKPFILKPLNTNGTVMISAISLINQATGEFIWSARTAKDFDQMTYHGSAVRIMDRKNLVFLVTGNDLQIDLFCEHSPLDAPAQFELWVKATKSQKLLNSNIKQSLILQPDGSISTRESLNLTAESVDNYPLIICTHHKAGSNFNLKVFRAISKKLSKKLWTKFYDPEDSPVDWEICLHQHSRIRDILSMQDFRGWHCVRHPKALILSAALYHVKCTEPWVDIPLEGFSSHTFWAASDGKLYNRIKDPLVSLDEKISIMNAEYTGKTPVGFVHYPSSYEMHGKTYREMLLSFSTIEEKVEFEMKSYSRGVINDMVNFPADKRFFRIKFESISKDTEMTSLREGFHHLGFRGQDLEKCLEIAAENCLWKMGKERIENHATTGMSDEWKHIFKGKLLRKYNALFPGVEEALGYPNDNK